MTEMSSNIKSEDLKKVSEKLNLIISSLESKGYSISSVAKTEDLGFFGKVGKKLDIFIDTKVLVTAIVLIIAYQSYIYLSNRNLHSGATP